MCDLWLHSDAGGPGPRQLRRGEAAIAEAVEHLACRDIGPHRGRDRRQHLHRHLFGTLLLGWGWEHHVPDSAEYRWAGMGRGIGNALPDPAIEVMMSPWAASVVERAIITEQRALAFRAAASRHDERGDQGGCRRVTHDQDEGPEDGVYKAVLASVGAGHE